MIEKYFEVKNGCFRIKKVFIVAEIGSNHCQDLGLAFELIDAAKESGADAVKFQSLKLSDQYYRPSKKISALFKKIGLEENWVGKLKKYSDKKKIIFFSSPTYLRAIDILEDAKVEIYKIASAQAGTFPQLVRKVAGLDKPVFLSTGLLTTQELSGVVRLIRSAGNRKLAILHCNSIYPAPYKKVNLSLIGAYHKLFGCPVGFSDHARDIFMPIAAVALGARVIEKHFMLDKKRASPDRIISLLPHQFKRMSEGIRAIEVGLGDAQRKSLEPEEEIFKDKIIHRLILKNNKRKGDHFRKGDFEFKRYHLGIDCRQESEVLKSFSARCDLRKYSLLTWDNIAPGAQERG